MKRLVYVGHTTDFTKRKNCHKRTCNNENTKAFNYKLYKMIRANGGWDSFKMVMIEEYPCMNKLEACRREDECMRQLKATMNSRVAVLDKEKAMEYHKQYNNKYYEANKEKLSEQKKQYYEANKEKLLEQHKQYLEANKEKILQQVNKYREANKEKCIEQHKQYYEANREKSIGKNKNIMKRIKKKSTAKSEKNVSRKKRT
jgi:hypothetical protein